ncbi:Tol2 transposase [Triplophysa rosa]|uniref:Tol2 transposase n=1 Tax=Triplophysa rosa TaxID=992332 RepID=A0A9W7WW87_TRIRA|nr:Tol2 transposase [Triplophysa rosa]
MEAPAAGSAANVTTPVADDEHLDYSGELGELDNVTHPWPYLQDFFSYIGVKNSSYRIKCLLCLPRVTEILAFKNSPSNLKKHIERKHVGHLKKYEELTSRKRKRAPETLPTTSTIRQTTLVNTRTVSQRSIDKAILKYVVQGLQPFHVVEQQPFRDFVKELQPNAKMISRLTLCSMIDNASMGMKKAVTEAMRGVDHIATTTDCWSARRQSFIGITGHWIDPNSLKRCSAALACKQLRGSHTFDVLASALNDIHSEFEIRGKIVRTTTDNSSNFIKAFQVFGEDENNNAVGSDGDPGNASQPGEDEEDQEGCEEVEFVDVSALLNEDDGLEFQLPQHQRCACHLLNLIATVDAMKATSNEAYKKVYRSTFGKCNALRNKCGRSTLAAETVEDVCSFQLLRPNATRWNSKGSNRYFKTFTQVIF